MGEQGKEVRGGVTCCTWHGTPYVWIEVKIGKSQFVCPECLAGKPKGDGPTGPLIRWGQTFWRDRPLTEKEKAHKPKPRSI